MAIEGLQRAHQAPDRELSDDIGIAATILVDELGVHNDRDYISEQVKADFESLAAAGRVGERYIWLPESIVSTPEMFAAADAPWRDQEFLKTGMDKSLWVPGADLGGYTSGDFGKLERGQTADNVPAHARLAIVNPDSPYDPLSHFLGQPFDEKNAERGQETQLEAIAKAKVTYEAEHPDFNLNPLAVKGVAYIARARRLKGQPLPFAKDFMRDATLERKTVGGDSLVGCVDSSDGQLMLGRSLGCAYSDGGVGLSVGPNLELQDS